MCAGGKESGWRRPWQSRRMAELIVRAGGEVNPYRMVLCAASALCTAFLYAGELVRWILCR